ncbi:MAG: hydrogenase formation protein HypD [Lachnospiraceae bacterium]|nr:hydrogenase formation protein HypD [Lachnospiraceae bacterium]
MPSELELCRAHPQEYIKKIAALDLPEVNLMEVCGTHTMAIAKAGLRAMLPPNVHLLSGPGCPVCVTPAEVIDEILKLAGRPDVVIATYGDMIRVPGSRRGWNLGKMKASGSRVEVVYSPVDALDLAAKNPEKKIVFLGVGFETTAPGTAASVLLAEERGVSNYYVFSMLKTVEPALRTLIADPEFNVQGFLCPGHVAVITGEKGFSFLPEEYGIPAVISGFEPEDILLSVYKLLLQIHEKRPRLENTYTRAVAPEGNPLAESFMDKVLARESDLWRGLGEIPESALMLRPAFSRHDAKLAFGVSYKASEGTGICRCGDVIQGRLSPAACPLFGKACTPEDPYGPCMVSSEGTCAAAYKYQEV